MGNRVPLTTLVAWAWIAHTIEVDNVFEALGAERVGHRFRISLPLWTNGLRFMEEHGVTIDVLRGRAKAACNIGGLERWGWISVGDGGDKRRDGFGTHRGVKGDTVVRPTRAGVYARKLWPQVVSGVEEQWRIRFERPDSFLRRAAGAANVPTSRRHDAAWRIQLRRCPGIRWCCIAGTGPTPADTDITRLSTGAAVAKRIGSSSVRPRRLAERRTGGIGPSECG
jgi:hypothetical protein